MGDIDTLYFLLRDIAKAHNRPVAVVDPRPRVGQFRAGGSAGNFWDMKSVYNGGDSQHLNVAGNQEFAQVLYEGWLGIA